MKLFRGNHEEQIGCAILVIVAIAVPLVFAIWFGIDCLLALLVQYVFTGFGCQIPYWPTVGAIFLIKIVVCGVSANLRRN